MAPPVTVRCSRKLGEFPRVLGREELAVLALREREVRRDIFVVFTNNLYFIVYCIVRRLEIKHNDEVLTGG